MEDLVFLKSSQASQNSTFSSLNSDFKNVLKAARPSGENASDSGWRKIERPVQFMCVYTHMCVYIYMYIYSMCIV